jgi:hypothetical protein
MFGQALKDVLSGYRVFLAPLRQILSGAVGWFRDRNRTERTCAGAGAAGRRDRDAVLRPAAGIVQQLNTWRDGLRILGTILKLYRSEKPMRFFTAIGIFLTLVSIGLAIPVIVTYLEQGIVPRLPTAVLSMGLMILAVLSVSSGLVLDTVTRGRREMKLLAYLSHAPISKN